MSAFLITAENIIRDTEGSVPVCTSNKTIDDL